MTDTKMKISQNWWYKNIRHKNSIEISSTLKQLSTKYVKIILEKFNNN